MSIKGIRSNTMKHFTCRRDIDHGWAWVVLIAAYLCAVINSTSIFMSGVLYLALLERYNEGEAKTALVGAISSGLLCFTAPVGGIINNKFSCRCSIIIGGILTGVGYAVSAIVPDLNWMLLTAGVVVGTGYGIASAGFNSVVGFHFDHWRGPALSCIGIFIGVGMFASSPFSLYLLDSYGFVWTFATLGCMQMQMCVLGMLCRPSVIEDEVRLQKIQRLRETHVNRSFKSYMYIDFSILLQTPYTLFLLSVSCWNFALGSILVHLPNYIHTLGGSSSEIEMVMVSFSIANVTGRFIGAITTSKFADKCLHIQIIIMGISGPFTALFLFCSRVSGGTYIMAVQLAFFTGWPNTMMTPLSMSFVGLNKLSEANAFAFFFSGVGMSGGPVVIALLNGVTGSYEHSFIVAGVVLMLGSFLGLVSLCRRGTAIDQRNLTPNKVDIHIDARTPECD